MRSTEVIGARLPRSAANELKQRAAAANTSAGAIVRAALEALKSPAVRAAVAQLSPEMRATLAPAVTAAPRPVASRGPTFYRDTQGRLCEHDASGRVRVVDPKPLKTASAKASKQYDQPVERRETISDTCELAKDCSDDELLEAVREINRQAAAESANKPDKKSAPEPAPEQLRRTAERRTPRQKAVPAKRGAPSAAPQTFRAPVTRETLRQHLGLSESTSSHEIRRHAKNALSGLRGLGSSPERAAALRSHLGLPRSSGEDHALAIVWTLTAPSTAANPYLKRLARK